MGFFTKIGNSVAAATETVSMAVAEATETVSMAVAAVKGDDNTGKAQQPSPLETDSGVFNSYQFEVAQNIGGGSFDNGYGIATDNHGNVWTTGGFGGSIDIDGDGINDLTSNGGSDSYVAKFDSDGNFLFAQNIGGSSTDFGNGIATDNDGNVWTTGGFGGSIDIDGDGTNDLTSNGFIDSYVAKFDSDGNFLFAQNIGGSSVDNGNGIVTDNDGNVWTTGDFAGSIDIDGDSTNDLTSNGSADSYIAKFDSDGNFLFAQNIGGGSFEEGNDIATDNNGNVWTTGSFDGSIDIDGDGTNDLTSNGSADSYIAKFDSEGNFLFAQNIGGGDFDFGNGIATDNDGNVWTTGEFQNSIDIDGDGEDDLTSNGFIDSYVAKFDSDGNFLFAQNIGGGSSDYGNSIATDNDGNVWTTGGFERSIDIDGDGTNDLTNNGSDDSYVAKFDSEGNFLFAQNIGGGRFDEGYGIATDNDGNVWTTGSFRDNIDINGDGTNDLTSNGFIDSYIVKFSSVDDAPNFPPNSLESNYTIFNRDINGTDYTVELTDSQPVYKIDNSVTNDSLNNFLTEAVLELGGTVVRNGTLNEASLEHFGGNQNPSITENEAVDEVTIRIGGPGVRGQYKADFQNDADADTFQEFARDLLGKDPTKTQIFEFNGGTNGGNNNIRILTNDEIVSLNPELSNGLRTADSVEFKWSGNNTSGTQTRNNFDDFIGEMGDIFGGDQLTNGNIHVIPTLNAAELTGTKVEISNGMGDSETWNFGNEQSAENFLSFFDSAVDAFAI